MESVFYAKSWEQFTFRPISGNDEENTCIKDADVGQWMVTKKGRHIESVMGRNSQCNNYLGSKSTFTKCQIVSAVTVTSSLSLPPTLVIVNESVSIEDDNQN